MKDYRKYLNKREVGLKASINVINKIYFLILKEKD